MFPSLEKVLAFEEAWDGRMGGVRTRAFRDVLMYIVGRLVSVGVAPDDVTTYIDQCVDTFLPDQRPNAGAS